MLALVWLLLTQTCSWVTWRKNTCPTSTQALHLLEIYWWHFWFWSMEKTNWKNLLPMHLNSSHNTTKFTHEFSNSSISFLDVTISLDNNNQISIDLFVKSTDTYKYLLKTSCHLSHVKRPYRSASHSTSHSASHSASTSCLFHHWEISHRTSELLAFLFNWGYKRQYVQAHINNPSKIPRSDTLYNQSKKNIDLPVFVIPGVSKMYTKLIKRNFKFITSINNA